MQNNEMIVSETEARWKKIERDNPSVYNIIAETFAISKKEMARIVREYEEKMKTMSDEDFETFITIIPHVD